MQWLRHYLQAYKKLSHEYQEDGGKTQRGSGAVSEEELEALYIQVNQFSLVSMCLTWKDREKSVTTN